MEESQNIKLINNRRGNESFYKQTAIAAMQGIQEANSRLGLVADLVPTELAKQAFNIADAMLEEMVKRLNLNYKKLA